MDIAINNSEGEGLFVYSFAGVDKDKMTILGDGSPDAGVILSRNEIALEWNSK